MLRPTQYAVVVRSVPMVLPCGLGRTSPWHYVVRGERLLCGWAATREQAWACALATLRGMMRSERTPAVR